jgi:hypothetical protein
MSSSFLHSPSSRRGFRTLVLGLVVLAAYVAYRGAPAERGADFERARTTRHLVGLAARVDKDALKAWLDEQEARDAAAVEAAKAGAASAPPTPGGPAAAPSPPLR